MNLLFRGGLVLLSVFVMNANTAVAGHWTSAADVMRESHRLDQATTHFHELLHNITGVSHIAEDAHRLASSARHLHATVEAGATYEHVVNDYFRMKAGFTHLRRQVRTDRFLRYLPHIRRDWFRVEIAMHNLEYAMEYDDDHHGDLDPHHNR